MLPKSQISLAGYFPFFLNAFGAMVIKAMTKNTAAIRYMPIDGASPTNALGVGSGEENGEGVGSGNEGGDGDGDGDGALKDEEGGSSGGTRIFVK
jgi:hypothetical protein